METNQPYLQNVLTNLKSTVISAYQNQLSNVIYIYIYISKNTSIACINLNILKTRGDSKNPNPKIFIGKKNIHIPPIHLAILFVSAKHSGQKQQQQETRARTHTSRLDHTPGILICVVEAAQPVNFSSVVLLIILTSCRCCTLSSG